MPYNLIGDDHYETNGPTTQGLKELREFITANEKECPALAQFITEGIVTTKKDVFIVECGILARRPDTPEYIKLTLQHLRLAASNSGSFLAIVQ